MFFVTTAAVLIFGLVAAQDPDCDYRQNIGPNERYYINNNYSAGRTCRYIVVCTSGYNCRSDCVINMPSSNGCNGDRMLISRSGDPTLTGAEAYCGSRSVTATSTGTSLSIGIVALTNSPGGRVNCELYSQPAATTPNPPICRCGVKKTSRIVGGQETRPNEYNMMAAIIDSSTESIYCGGVIISNFFILTAAHCLYPYRNNPRALFVLLGAHDIENPRTGTRYSISRFIIHENYNANTFDYDIALVRTALEIVFSENVFPVCLPFKFENTDFINRLVTLLGWGTTSFGGQTAEKLRKVDVRVISQSSCQSSEGSNVGPRQLCTYTPGKDACQFDSGGPGIYTDTDTGLIFVLATISNGRMCATGSPGINTRITAFLRWIINNANSNFCIIR